MHRKVFLHTTVLVAITVLITLSSAAELQNVFVGGQVRIRGSFWRQSFDTRVAPWLVGPALRIPSSMFRARPIGDAFGGQNVMSFWDWNSRGSDYRLIEQRTTLNVRADFTDLVTAFIELESFDLWGEDFRSDYVTGVDRRAATGDDIEVYQSYIEAAEVFDTPLRLRIGRQELAFGSQWLIGTGSRFPEFRGNSFDAVRLTYGGDSFSTDLFWAKLAENSPFEEDGDIDLYGLYGSCMAVENWTFDAYWFWLRDARAVKDTNLGVIGEWIEDVVGVDDYDPTNLHTVGLRASGTMGAFDLEAEAAYQFGDAGQVGALFKPFIYGDDDAEFDSWAADAEVGYRFDMAWQPRIYLGGAYFGGEDNRDVSFLEWLFPFDRAEASVSFNRLFSNTVYSPILDEIGALSNFWAVRGGIEASPTEKIDLKLNVAYYESVEQFDQPIPRPLYWKDFVIALSHPFSFLTSQSDAELGWETDLTATYRYSEDLSFEAGWSHLFTGDGLTAGNYVDLNGLSFSGGTSDDDADYFYWEGRLCF